MKWISVEERLPEYDVNVLMVENGCLRVGQLNCDDDGCAWSNVYQIQGCLYSSEADFDDDYRPSHWMPLPELPEV